MQTGLIYNQKHISALSGAMVGNYECQLKLDYHLKKATSSLSELLLSLIRQQGGRFALKLFGKAR